ncbi:MAG: DUF1320 domain-containing protein, partial [Prevotellaceae bacterium]|nr:DUF1320 domain-containing protein [Prevotellaceae bacterium]
VRYDCDAIFSAAGDARNGLILMMALDITVYNIFCVHNPQKISQITKDRYDRALEWLRRVSRGEANIDGAPLLPSEHVNSPFLTISNRKRTNHY